MIGSSRWVLVMRARQARPAPMASAPVSPMKIRAGAAFHQRKPVQAPTMAAATSARSRPWGTSYWRGWRKAQKAISV